MLKTISKLFRPSWPTISRWLIVIAWLAIVCTNVAPQTRNLSWDLMDSSFNPSLNVWRSLLGTWQSFQGLGVLGGHGYAAQLPHALLAWLLDLFFPQDWLRYLYAFTMLLLGATGCYQLSQAVYQKLPGVASSKLQSQLSSAAATVSSFVYLLHYGTVQTFYVHLEPFITMYGLLPWILWLLFEVFQQPSYKKIAVFLGLNFFLSMVGFIPPIFISYVIFVSIALACYLLSKPSWSRLRTSLTVTLIIALTNLYWLSSVATFTFLQPDSYLKSKLNQLTTREFIIKNESYGQLKNVALMNSFYSDSLDQPRFDTSQTVEPILKPWQSHSEKVLVKAIGFTLFGLAVTGWGISLWYFFKTREQRHSLSLMGIVSLSLIGTGIPVLKWLPQTLSLLPPLEQAFRIPYTKLSMSLTLFLALGVGYCLIFCLSHLARVTSVVLLKSITLLITLSLLIGLGWYSLPSFYGHFLYKGSRVQLPSAYPEAMTFLSATDKATKRILPLPIATSSGWDMHQWGYTGSGFWWYGMPNPIAHRSFDVWSPYNETLYLKISTALYANDAQQLSALLDSYDISYVVFDDSVVLPDKKPSLLLPDQTKQLLATLGGKVVFQKPPLTIWDVTATQTTNGEVYMPDAPTVVETDDLFTRWNTAFQFTHPNYLSSTTTPASHIFPFSYLSSEHVQNVTASDSGFVAQYRFKRPVKTGLITVPSYQKNDTYTTTATMSKHDQSIHIAFPAAALVANNQVQYELPKLTDLDIPTSTTSGYVIKIGDKQIILNDREQLSVPLTFKIGQPFTIDYFSSALVEEVDGQPSVDIKNVETINIDESIWLSLMRPYSLPFNFDLNSLNLVIDSAPIVVDFTQNDIQNCQTPAVGKVNRTIDTKGVIRFTAAENGSACQGVLLTTTSNHQGYLLQIEGENHNGRSLKFYLTNLVNDRADLEYLLPNKQFNQFFTILPWPKLAENRYAFNLETRSFGSESSNSVQKAQLFPYDLFQVSNIVVQNTSAIQQDVIAPQGPSNLKTRTVGTGLYFVQLNNTSDIQQPLVLSQAYDEGWLALLLSQPQKWWNPSQYRLLNTHTRYNGWANAWIIPDRGTHTVLLFYWPQLLSFAGFIALGVSGWTLLLLTIHNRQRQQIKRLQRFA